MGNLIPYIWPWDPGKRIEVVRLFASTGKSTLSYTSNQQTPNQTKAVNLELRSRGLQYISVGTLLETFSSVVERKFNGRFSFESGHIYTGLVGVSVFAILNRVQGPIFSVKVETCWRCFLVNLSILSLALQFRKFHFRKFSRIPGTNGPSYYGNAQAPEALRRPSPMPIPGILETFNYGLFGDARRVSVNISAYCYSGPAPLENLKQSKDNALGLQIGFNDDFAGVFLDV